ncbi:MAG TPA: phosphate ABC transporter substrate-binding protein PstS [Thermoleophilaceae bacterium]
MKSRQWLAVLPVAGALVLGVAACGSSGSSDTGSGGGSTGSGSSVNATLNGAGSTFAAPIYQQFGSNLKDQGLTINYQPVGSGAGVAQFTAGTVNFGATDPPLKPEEMAAAKAKHGQPLQFPVAFGAITVSYNLSGVKSGLKLDGKTIADIFLGKVTTWNDPEIASQNQGISLPSSKITVVHRSDESGTTKGFTDFLQSYSPEWKSKVGSDKTVKWPTGTGAKGNDGVAAAIKQTSNSIGYVEQAYALQNNFTFADVKNKSGKYVAPSLESTSAAGDGVTVPSDLSFTVINSPNPAAYPISSQTFVLFYKDLCKGGMNANTAKGAAAFLNYVYGDGQKVLEQLSYAPLPSAIASKAKAQVSELQCNGSPVSAS